MLISELYEQIGGDYKGILSRLPSDDLVKRFLLKFLDEKSYDELLVAAQEENIEASIAAAHKLKGVTANLSFTLLFDALNALLTQLRQENVSSVDKELLREVTVQYEKIVQLIKEL